MPTLKSTPGHEHRQPPNVAELIATYLASESDWHIGAIGAVAEFRRDGNSTPCVNYSVDTPSGAIRILSTKCRPFAYELPTRRAPGWESGIMFCLPQADAAMNQRSTVTPLGEDRDAMRSAESNHLLFDLGLGLPNADFCVRTDSPEVIDSLLRAQGTELLKNPALFQYLQEVSPHRVVISRVARIEVRQPIAQRGHHSPPGSHTHLLPNLLKTRRTHPTTIPLPKDLAPCLWLHPPYSLKHHSAGLPMRLDVACHDAFQRLLEQFGDVDAISAKRRALEYLRDGLCVDQMAKQASRHERLAMRIALLQHAELTSEG